MLAHTVTPNPPAPPARGPSVRRWAAFAVAIAVNLVVLFAPSPDVPGDGVPGLDKVVHVAVFAAVTLTGLRAGLRAPWFVPVVLAHAVLSEVVQAVVLPQRSGDPWDVLADVVGVALGYAAFRYAASRRAAG